MRYLATCLIVLTSVCVSACAKSGLGEHNQGYVTKSQQVSPVIVPNNVPSINKDTYYVVPSIPVSDSTRTVSTLPPTLEK